MVHKEKTIALDSNSSFALDNDDIDQPAFRIHTHKHGHTPKKLLHAPVSAL